MIPEAAVAIVHAGGHDGFVLLMLRAEREGDSWSGHWSFPGGRCDPGDPDLLHTALRELEEECGVRLERGKLEVALPPVLARRRSGPYLPVVPFVFRVDRELPAVPDLHEAVEARWVPLAWLRDPARHRLQCVPGMPPEVAFPCVPFGGPPLWGFTYRLMTEWLRLVPREQAAGRAAFEMADALLEFLIAQGLTLRRPWRPESAAVTSAVVEGAIPAAQVLGHFAVPGRVPPVNALEARADFIRLAGLAFEEYRIHAEGA
jgi:8-oxo-dGTP pyrophosphatase MutT (NUDIX family)